MRMYDIILKKRNGQELTSEEINYFIDNYTKGYIPDYQAAALIMAIYFQKMNKRETADLTMAMAHSGDVLDLSSINGIKVDKHSTGGVGDTTTLVLGPMVASLGIPVAKMSGRGLGHTGGTIDKLESFSGFSVEMPEDKFIENVNRIKLVVGGQTGNLAPADKKLYALRDVTATVDNISLIASSIMSKKIAAGADCIVLDVKVGEGAFMKTKEDAFHLAEEMVSIGKNVNRTTVAVISDMDQPLGFAVGNALEVKEAINTLKGKGPDDLLQLCLTLGSHMLVLAKRAKDEEEGRRMLIETIETGKALSKLKEFVEAQGGDSSFVDYTDKFPKAEYIIPVKSKIDGYVRKIHAENIGVIAMDLGAGRATKEDKIDLAVGIVLSKKRGDKVYKGDVLAYIYANDIKKAKKAEKDILESYIISDIYNETVPLIYGIVK
ncbi:pyrimidine-nucleoside phosphorylase [Clostridium tetanomorphum DSM 665]|uniref:Pyrimidine-nucleoside phosphorylase n=1 Tax=Clostridium tetanomorphum TaxID=1553 RepID=A0A923E8U4_CLOTT|nr:pyrimidine-nucleoside phosphorylase [Clostridium tetanomorphum]KAJ51461.1 pyrimidine-nucleoside phosphorylase [Clostridium tetanomorphum DSM 665]MBC2396554.1 pyrimidine-nucleoside phosphorylase [Clostridium tetanomorphum]NRZ98175.1 pyrimidine-nucleoside phosphorylase [Clostridium tetanomorphum]